METTWKDVSVDVSDLDLSGDRLRAQWDAMHTGNLEPFPLDARLQEAWRRYHLGRFAEAVQLGSEMGGPGLVPAAFATTIYAQYVETDPTRKADIFMDAAKICERAIDAGIDTANLHYMHAVSMGRYSQFISTIEALAQGYGGKIKAAVERCLERAPDHAEGHITLGGWHANITDQAGLLMGRMLYGATQDDAGEHFERAIQLAPNSPVVHLEFARGLEIMYGKSEHARITSELEQALALTPADAMQRLDVAEGRRHLAKLHA